ncbi:MAG: YkgJ family cysteine cluster protein [Lachnospiraceae bacterium]|jgi:Fe-S-cluster containining protein|nr:YkgJ family cysteine cluster protein [Lachnospiraceae bacterium]
MDREIDMKEVSDGKLYGLRDMVKADCGGCEGCSDCCRSMGNSIILDPYDIYRLTIGLRRSFEKLLDKEIELNLVEGIILPNLKMSGIQEKCSFLNEEGRCTIHSFRPGICRIFPLGRYYENESFQYFLQVHECRKEPKTKIKVQKWIDTPNPKQNETFIIEWHYFLKALSRRLEHTEEGSFRKSLSMYILKNFYLKPYEENQDFYEQFRVRLAEAKKL